MASDGGDGNGHDSLKLRELIEGLPQELQDIIFDMAFTADPKVHIYACGQDIHWCKLKDLAAECSTRVVDLNEDLHAHLLWVDRHSRQKFASSYYGHDSVFVIYSPLYWKFVEDMGSLRDLISDPRLVTVARDARVQPIIESVHRKCWVKSGLDAAFASRMIFTEHNDVVKLVRQRAGISTEDAEVNETPSEGEKEAED